MDAIIELSRLAFRRSQGLDTGPVAYSGEPQPEAWFNAARRHRVVGLWESGLPLAEMLPGLASAWKGAAYGQALHGTRLTAEAERITAALGASIPELRIIKGPALAVQAWAQPGVRCFDDLDFRCDRAHGKRLAEGLRSLGYREEPPDAGRAAHLWHFGWGVMFRHADGMRVECNHRMFPPHFPWPERLTWAPAPIWQSQRLDGSAMLAPSPPLHLLLSCMHALWHGWERLAWVADMAGLLVRHPGITTAAAKLADGGLSTQALDAGCRLANAVFGPLPGMGAREADSAHPAVAAALVQLQRGWASMPLAMQRRLHHDMMTPCERLAYTLRRGFTPGSCDFTTWPLSPRWRNLYWLMRPLRLAARGWGRHTGQTE